MQKIRWFFLIVGIVLTLAMALQNNTPTDIQLLWLKAQFPLSVLLIVATAVGFLFGALLTASMLRSRKAAAKAKAAAKPAPKLDPSPSKPSTESPL